MEYFALFAPAFSRRPYVGEDMGAIVVETDYSLAGMLLHLSATVGGITVGGRIEGGRRSRLEFSLASLPPWVNEMVSITLTLPDGTNITKARKFLRAPPPSADATTTVVQSDGESPGLLFDGQRQLANGWFGSWNISSQGPGGISFISKGGIRPDRSFLLPGQEANYSKQWAEIHAYLDAAADAGAHSLSLVLSFSLSLSPEGVFRGRAPALRVSLTLFPQRFFLRKEIESAVSLGCYVCKIGSLRRFVSCGFRFGEMFI